MLELQSFEMIWNKNHLLTYVKKSNLNQSHNTEFLYLIFRVRICWILVNLQTVTVKFLDNKSEPVTQTCNRDSFDDYSFKID